jgi:hypothetical protein
VFAALTRLLSQACWLHRIVTPATILRWYLVKRRWTQPWGHRSDGSPLSAANCWTGYWSATAAILSTAVLAQYMAHLNWSSTAVTFDFEAFAGRFADRFYPDGVALADGGLCAQVVEWDGAQEWLDAGWGRRWDRPQGMQRLLNFYAWDAGRVEDDMRAMVVAALGDAQGECWSSMNRVC